MGKGTRPPAKDPRPPEDERTKAHRRFQKKMERQELSSHRDGLSLQKTFIGLAVSTLMLCLTMLAIVSKLDVNKTEDVPPRLATNTDAEANEVHILEAESDLRWSDLKLDGNCTPLLNGKPLGETPQAAVQAGDVLECGSGETLQIHSSRDRGDAILYRSTFPEA